jgi:hypothetical protein
MDYTVLFLLSWKYKKKNQELISILSPSKNLCFFMTSLDNLTQFDAFWVKRGKILEKPLVQNADFHPGVEHKTNKDDQKVAGFSREM